MYCNQESLMILCCTTNHTAVLDLSRILKILRCLCCLLIWIHASPFSSPFAPSELHLYISFPDPSISTLPKLGLSEEESPGSQNKDARRFWSDKVSMSEVLCFLDSCAEDEADIPKISSAATPEALAWILSPADLFASGRLQQGLNWWHLW